jgi:hypothetical protein
MARKPRMVAVLALAFFFAVASARIASAVNCTSNVKREAVYLYFPEGWTFPTVTTPTGVWGLAATIESGIDGNSPPPLPGAKWSYSYYVSGSLIYWTAEVRVAYLNEGYGTFILDYCT